MPAKPKSPRNTSKAESVRQPANSAESVLADLKRKGTQATVEGMARYGIVTADPAVGVPMGTLLKMAKTLGKDHGLAQELWASKWYEARLLAALVDDPERVTGKQMDEWVAQFDNWAVCDTVCFKLFDQVPAAWEKAPKWAKSPREFVKRTGFVLMACLAAHDKSAADARFLRFFALIEKGATDERNFVKKGVSWALRMIGRRSASLRATAIEVARRLAESASAAARWVGKDALRELGGAQTRTKSSRKKA